MDSEQRKEWERQYYLKHADKFRTKKRKSRLTMNEFKDYAPHLFYFNTFSNIKVYLNNERYRYNTYQNS